MLPLVKININEICKIVEDFSDPGKPKIVVKTFVYKIDKFIQGLASFKEIVGGLNGDPEA
jgi:hypothetical protein